MKRTSLENIGNLDWLKCTDSRQEQLLIGERLLAEKKAIYTDARIASMEEEITILAPELNEVSLREHLLLSIYDFWVYGTTTSEEFYLGFLGKTDAEKREYISFCDHFRWVDKLNDRRDAHALADKFEAYKRFTRYYMREIVKIRDVGDYNAFDNFVVKHPIFVVKPCSASLGNGVRKVDVREHGDRKKLFDELIVANDGGKSYFKDRTFLLEEVIRQDCELERIHPYSINGVRITTLRDKDRVRIVYPWFKIGANKQFVTSAAFGTYDAGIDAETGVVNTDGFKENGEHDAVHPLTGIRFVGYQIPRWKDLVETVTELAKKLPSTINYVGWDMVLTPAGWCIMEGNFDGDFMWQMFLRKGFKAELESMTGMRLEKGFWWQHGK